MMQDFNRMLCAVFAGARSQRICRRKLQRRVALVPACVACERLESRVLLTTTFFDDGTLALVANNVQGIGEPAVPIFYNNVLINGENHQVVEAYDQVPGQSAFPLTFVDQGANFFARGTYQKSDGTTAALGTSVLGSVSFRESGTFNFVPTANRVDVSTGGPTRYQSLLSGQFGSLATVTSTRTFPDPVIGTTTVDVGVTFTAMSNISLATAAPFPGNDRFRVVTVSSMFTSSTQFDANRILYQDADGNVRSFAVTDATPTDQFLFSSPQEIGSWLELQKSDGSTWFPDSPTVHVDITRSAGLRLGIQGFLKGSSDPNDDSLSVWLEWIEAPDVVAQGTSIDVGFRVQSKSEPTSVPLSITTASLPNWPQNQPGYNQTVATSGGIFPLTFNVSTGTLPSGLTLNANTGAITGTPDASGTSTFTVQVTDQDGTSAAQQFTVTVSPVTPTAPQAPALAIASAGSPLSQTVFFFLGGDHQVYREKFDANQNLVSPATLVQPGAAGSKLAAGTLPDGSPVLFLLGSDNQVYKAGFDASGNLTSGFALTQAGVVQNIAATTDAGGNPLLLAIGSDNQVYFQRFNAGGVQTAGYALVSPGAVRDVSASGPVLFAQGLDHQIYQNRFNGASWNGYTLPAAGAVQSFTYLAATGLLLGIGGDNQLYAQRIDASGNSGGWFLTAAGGIQAVAQGVYSGNAEAFVIGGDSQLYVQRFDGSGNSLGYSATSPGAVKSIVATNLPGSPGVFAVGLDNQVYTLRFDNLSGAAVGGYVSANTGPVS